MSMSDEKINIDEQPEEGQPDIEAEGANEGADESAAEPVGEAPAEDA